MAWRAADLAIKRAGNNWKESFTCTILLEGNDGSVVVVAVHLQVLVVHLP
jgi:hypothetical protein